jgi:hypothetical protein
MVDLSLYDVDKKSIVLNSGSLYVRKELNPSIVLFDRFMMENNLVGELPKLSQCCTLF